MIGAYVSSQPLARLCPDSISNQLIILFRPNSEPSENPDHIGLHILYIYMIRKARTRSSPSVLYSRKWISKCQQIDPPEQPVRSLLVSGWSQTASACDDYCSVANRRVFPDPLALYPDSYLWRKGKEPDSYDIDDRVDITDPEDCSPPNGCPVSVAEGHPSPRAHSFIDGS